MIDNNLFSNQLSFNPVSIWEIPRKNPLLKKLVSDEENIREVKRTGGALGKGGIRFSEFKPDIAYRIYEYWSNKGDLVLDPFMGRATRGIIAGYMERKYIGFDVVKEYVDLCSLKFSKYENVKAILGDGCLLSDIKEESIDFIFTCPPYWNLEKYKSCKNQLSDIKNYKDFLYQINLFCQNSYKVLKDNKFIVVVIADFHKNNQMFYFHNDMINKLLEAGFRGHDIVINKVYSPFAVFASKQNKQRHWVGKIHEYILIFRK